MVRLVCAPTTTRTTMQLSSLVRTGTTSKWFATSPRPNPSIGLTGQPAIALHLKASHTHMSFVAFVIAAVILAITPGPGIAYVVARTVAGGRAEGLASCFGTGIGGMMHVLAAALGL